MPKKAKNSKRQKQPATRKAQIEGTQRGRQPGQPVKPPTGKQVAHRLQTKGKFAKPHGMWRDI